MSPTPASNGWSFVAVERVGSFHHGWWRGIVSRLVNTLLHRRIALLAVASVLIAACGSGAASTTTTTTTTVVVDPTIPPTTPTTAVIEPPAMTGSLTVWADPAVADAVRSRGILFGADTGITVTVVAKAEADILTALLDGSEEEPDLFVGPHTWLQELAVAGLTEPVTLGEDLPQGIIDAVSLRGFALAVPLAVDALVQVRNPAISPTRPTSADALVCQGCLLLPGDGDLDVTYPFLTSLGGYLFGPNPDNGYDVTDTSVDSPEAIAAATILQDLVAAGAVGTATDRADALARFEAGEAGIIWAGPEAIGVLAGEAVEALPTIGGAPAISPVRVTAAFVNGQGPVKAEAVRFAERYLGDQDGSRAIADASGMAPVWAGAATNIELVVLESAKTGQPVPYVAGTQAAWDEVAAAFARILVGTDAGTALIDAGDVIRFVDPTPQG